MSMKWNSLHTNFKIKKSEKSLGNEMRVNLLKTLPDINEICKHHQMHTSL